MSRRIIPKQPLSSLILHRQEQSRVVDMIDLPVLMQEISQNDNVVYYGGPAHVSSSSSSSSSSTSSQHASTAPPASKRNIAIHTSSAASPLPENKSSQVLLDRVRRNSLRRNSLSERAKLKAIAVAESPESIELTDIPINTESEEQINESRERKESIESKEAKESKESKESNEDIFELSGLIQNPVDYATEMKETQMTSKLVYSDESWETMRSLLSNFPNLYTILPEQELKNLFCFCLQQSPLMSFTSLQSHFIPITISYLMKIIPSTKHKIRASDAYPTVVLSIASIFIKSYILLHYIAQGGVPSLLQKYCQSTLEIQLQLDLLTKKYANKDYLPSGVKIITLNDSCGSCCLCCGCF